MICSLPSASSPLDSAIDEEESEKVLLRPRSTVAFDPKVQEKKVHRRMIC